MAYWRFSEKLEKDMILKKKVEETMTNMSNVYPVKSVATSFGSRADPFFYKKVIQHSQSR